MKSDMDPDFSIGWGCAVVVVGGVVTYFMFGLFVQFVHWLLG